MKKALELRHQLGSNVFNKEWKYFQKWARRYPDTNNYGILPMGANPHLDNMIYDKDVAKLRLKHINYIAEHGINTGHRQRIFIDWLEKLEGKQ